MSGIITDEVPKSFATSRDMLSLYSMMGGHQMDSELTKIDRWNSELLDVHTWSNHPEIKALTDKLYVEVDVNTLDKSGNKKPKTSAKDSLRVLLLDLYVKWLKDPNVSIGFSKAERDYIVGSRYNGLFISPNIIKIEAMLHHAGYTEELPHYHNSKSSDPSYTTRIRHTEKLRSEFKQLTIDLHDIDTHSNQECIILHDKFVDFPDDNKNKKITYDDSDLTRTLRDQLKAYNALLKRSFIDIPTFEKSKLKRHITKGKSAGQTRTVSLGADNKFVIRVFNGGMAGNWELGGRFYGGWWQQIDKGLRPLIYINDKPTLEIDFKALHPNLLANEAGEELSDDPYDLGELLLPEVLTTSESQRKYVKLLVLMAINADSDKKAFGALRNRDRTDKLGQSLTDEQQSILLRRFIELNPQLEESLNTGQALRLMGIDGKIANMVLDHFTKAGIPVLCIHDSFIIQYDKEHELNTTMDRATKQLTKSYIKADIKNDRNVHNARVPYESDHNERSNKEIKLPIFLHPTEQYKLRKEKFNKWLSTIDTSS